MLGVLVSVALMAQEQQAAREQKDEQEQFIELRLGMLRPAYPGATTEAFQAFVLPAVQVKPDQEVHEEWHGQRFGEDLNIRMSCIPHLHKDGEIVLEGLQVVSWASNPDYGNRLATIVSVRPGESLLLGGTITRDAETQKLARIRAYGSWR